MNKAWIGSLFYFLNVILYLASFVVVFAMAIPEEYTILENISAFWHYQEGRDAILINSILLVSNLLFAFAILILVQNSKTTAIVLTVISWAGVITAYFIGILSIFSYLGGAVYLSIFTYQSIENAAKKIA